MVICYRCGLPRHYASKCANPKQIPHRHYIKLDPDDIFYTQGRIPDTWDDTGESILLLVRDLIFGMHPDDVPIIRVLRGDDGYNYSLDNRRLWSFRMAKRLGARLDKGLVTVEDADPELWKEASQKMRIHPPVVEWSEVVVWPRALWPPLILSYVESDAEDIPSPSAEVENGVSSNLAPSMSCSIWKRCQ